MQAICTNLSSLASDLVRSAVLRFFTIPLPLGVSNAPSEPRLARSAALAVRAGVLKTSPLAPDESGSLTRRRSTSFAGALLVLLTFVSFAGVKPETVRWPLVNVMRVTPCVTLLASVTSSLSMERTRAATGSGILSLSCWRALPLECGEGVEVVALVWPFSCDDRAPTRTEAHIMKH